MKIQTRNEIKWGDEKNLMKKKNQTGKKNWERSVGSEVCDAPWTPKEGTQLENLIHKNHSNFDSENKICSAGKIVSL